MFWLFLVNKNKSLIRRLWWTLSEGRRKDLHEPEVRDVRITYQEKEGYDTGILTVKKIGMYLTKMIDYSFYDKSLT